MPDFADKLILELDKLIEEYHDDETGYYHALPEAADKLIRERCVERTAQKMVEGWLTDGTGHIEKYVMYSRREDADAAAKAEKPKPLTFDKNDWLPKCICACGNTMRGEEVCPTCGVTGHGRPLPEPDPDSYDEGSGTLAHDMIESHYYNKETDEWTFTRTRTFATIEEAEASIND